MKRSLLLACPLVALLAAGACDDSSDAASFGFDGGGPIVSADSGRVDATPTDSQAPHDAGTDANVDADAEAGEPEPPKTNLEVWLRADRGVTADAGKVATWVDQSGKGHDFAQPDPTRQPAIVDSDAGSSKALVFTGSEHLVADTTQLFPTNASPLTIAVVFTTTQVAGQKFVFNYGQANNLADNSNLELGYSTGDQSTANFGLHRGSSIGTTTAGGVIQENTVYRAVVSLSTTGTDPANLSIRLNGVAQTVASSAAGGFFSAGAYNTTSAPMEVGGRVDGNHRLATYAVHLADPGDAHHIGTISEVLVYKGGLADGDLPLLESYLAKR
jgi:hypothetical protein